MRLCIFEDRNVGWLEPLTLTRPAFELCCGVGSLRQRQHRVTKADEIGVLVRPALAEICRLAHSELPVNDPDWLRRGVTVFVNARWLPPAEAITDWTTPRVGLVHDQVAYVIVPTGTVAEFLPANVDEWIASWKGSRVPQGEAGGRLIEYPWDLVQHNPEMLSHDAVHFRKAKEGRTREAGIQVIGPPEQLVIDAEAEIDPYVVADTRGGPVLIDRGAVVQAFSRLEGPCYIGEETWIVGGKVRGGTIGPSCRIGGEFEATIVQGFSNKYHDGFLGHSYLGEWVNLAAGTQVSDLRNDYGTVKVTLGGERVSTGLTKVGAFIGDHTKTGLGALLNTGSIIGAFCSLLPSGSLLPSTIPSFCTAKGGVIQERNDLRQMIATAATVMKRRGRELTGAHVDFFFSLYDETSAERRNLLRELERRRLRESV